MRGCWVTLCLSAWSQGVPHAASRWWWMHSSAAQQSCVGGGTLARDKVNRRCSLKTGVGQCAASDSAGGLHDVCVKCNLKWLYACTWHTPMVVTQSILHELIHKKRPISDATLPTLPGAIAPMPAQGSTAVRRCECGWRAASRSSPRRPVPTGAGCTTRRRRTSRYHQLAAFRPDRVGWGCVLAGRQMLRLVAEPVPCPLDRSWRAHDVVCLFLGSFVVEAAILGECLRG
jgi:hypothetical protein